MIVAIEVFRAPDTIKSVIAAAGPLGLLFTPLSLSLFSRIGKPASKMAAYIAWASAVLMGIGAFAGSLNGFLVSVCLAFALSMQSMPLLVHVWTSNFPSNKRGSYLAVSMMFSIAATLVFSHLGGALLDKDLEWYRPLLMMIAVAYATMGWAVWQIPSTAISQRESQNPLRNLSYAVSDWKFGVMLASWMFLGMGNLMVLPIRFEYLLQPEYGIEASKVTVSWITLGVPAVFRLLTSRFWGAMFDRVNFMALRMVLNAMILTSIVLFLSTKELWLIFVSAAVLGTAMAGANISWSLWVTKFAPPERTAAYMSVHTFTTGIRGVAAPFVGFGLLSGVGAGNTALIGGSLVGISIVMVGVLFLSQRGKTS